MPPWSNMKHAISVIIPCKNEELNILDCLASCRGVADEIIVADSGSEDRTLSLVARHADIRVITREYRTSGDFKNWAIPQAQHEWIVLVDADERITPELSQEIHLTLSRGPEFDAYWIRRQNHFLGRPLRWGDARTDRVVRLFRRDRGRYEGPSDHGEIRIPNGRIGRLKCPLLHYSVWSYRQLIAKYERYTSLQAAEWHAAGKDTSTLKLLVRPAWRFFREYILQAGILDGKAGLQLAWLAAYYSFLKQARLWELNHGIEQPRPMELAAASCSDPSRTAA